MAVTKHSTEPASMEQMTRILLLAVVIVLLLGAVAFSLIRNNWPLQCAPLSAIDKLPVPTPKQLADADGVLSLTVIDVGQGDALLLQSPSGKTMLIDAGDSDSFAAIERVLMAYGIETLDVAVATHPHLDHIGAMADVLRHYPVGAFYLTDYPASTEQYGRMLKALQKNGCSVIRAVAGMTVAWDDDVTVTVLNPFDGWTYADANNSSVVLRVEYGAVAFLLTGDMEAETEALLIAAYDAELLRADVLKLGHHGSNSSSSGIFLDAVQPRIALASVGKNNAYGHPHAEVLDRLKERSITLYRTDQTGIVTVFTDGATVLAVP